MLDRIKLALRVTIDDFDQEIQDLIEDCLQELAGYHVYHEERHYKYGVLDKQIESAVIFYCKWKFGNNPDAERWEEIYHDKVTKLLVMEGYGIDPDDGAEE